MRLLSEAGGSSTGIDKTYRQSAPGVPGVLIAAGTWDGATAKLQYSQDSSNWIDVEDAAFSANGMIQVFLPSGFVRGVTSGGGGSTSISLDLE